ncbi:MAG: glycosyltransferase family 2 protein [Desulfobulbaceae bacterium]
MKISVVTTCFNAAGTILDCLESVKGQTHPDVEHVVVDAASTDGTLALLEEYKESLARVISEPDRGIYDGMNKGLRLATGDVVGILNADDSYFCPDVLAEVARVFEDKAVDSCYGDLVYVAVGNEGIRFKVKGSREKKNKKIRVVRYWRSGEFDPRKFYWGWMPPHPTFFVRRSVYEKYGGFNLDLGTAADYELMLRFLVKYRISSTYLPEILIAMRAGGASNATLARRIRANAMDRKAWEVNGLKPLPWTLLLKPLRKLGQWIARPR